MSSLSTPSSTTTPQQQQFCTPPTLMVVPSSFTATAAATSSSSSALVSSPFSSSPTHQQHQLPVPNQQHCQLFIDQQQPQQQQSLNASLALAPIPTVITSIPPQQGSQRSLPAKTAIRLVHDRLRRQSYDVRVLNANGSGANAGTGNSVGGGAGGGGRTSAASHLRPYRTASARLNQSFTSPSLASAPSVFSLSAAKRRCSRLISFGFASAGFYVHRGINGDEEWLEEFEFEFERPSTSQSQNDEEEMCYSDMPSTVEDDVVLEDVAIIDASGCGGGQVMCAADEQTQQFGIGGNGDSNSQLQQQPQQQQPQYRSRPQQSTAATNHYAKQKQQQQQQQQQNAAAGGDGANNGGNGSRRQSTQQPVALFLLRQLDHRIVPVYCNRPQGTQADQFIQSLTERNLNSIKKFLENHHPEESECYLWVRDDATMKCTVLSLTLLHNHFKSEHIRRVKWRHLSVDKMSIYRYSLPVITTKFRLRVAGFLARNYRCCILGVWCLVILCISIGIVLSVVLGSAPGAQKANGTVSIQQVIQRSGGFMEDAIEMEEQASIINTQQQQQQQHQQPLVMTAQLTSGRGGGGMKGRGREMMVMDSSGGGMARAETRGGGGGGRNGRGGRGMRHNNNNNNILVRDGEEETMVEEDEAHMLMRRRKRR